MKKLMIGLLALSTTQVTFASCQYVAKVVCETNNGANVQACLIIKGSRTEDQCSYGGFSQTQEIEFNKMVSQDYEVQQYCMGAKIQAHYTQGYIADDYDTLSEVEGDYRYDCSTYGGSFGEIWGVPFNK